MKTPEEVAREALRLTIVPRANMGTASEEDMDRVAAALAERDKRADALAEALRELLVRHRDDRRTEQYRSARDAAYAALAAYDAEAK